MESGQCGFALFRNCRGSDESAIGGIRRFVGFFEFRVYPNLLDELEGGQEMILVEAPRSVEVV